MPLKEEDNQKYYETLMEILDVRRELKKINTCEIRGKEFTIHFMAIWILFIPLFLLPIEQQIRVEKDLAIAFETLVPNDLDPFCEEIQKDSYKWYMENIANKEAELVELKKKMDDLSEKKIRLHNRWVVLNNILKRLGFTSFVEHNYTDIAIKDPRPIPMNYMRNY